MGGVWTAGAFTAALELLLGVCCLYTGGDWFFVAGISVFFGLCLVLLPFVLRRLPLPEALASRKTLLCLGADLALLLALLGVCCVYAGGDWFWITAVSVIFAAAVLLLPFVMKQLPLPEALRRHRAALWLGTVSLLLFVLLGAACLYDGGDWFLLPALPMAVYGLLLPWGVLVLARYLRAGGWFRAAAAFGFMAVWYWLFPWVLDRVMAVKILTDGGKACGALGWNVSTGEFHIIRAKTVVSAQGRSATRGTDNSTHNPYNVWMYPYNTSAGVVLGYDAGAAVTELDTYQRATMLPKGYGCPGMNGINSSGAHEINALGERFMGKYDPMWENGVRNNQIQGTFQEQLEGSGPPFYMDMRHVDEAVVRELQDILMPGDKATFGDWAECTGTDFQHKLLEVEIGELIFGGTIAVNDQFETSVPGLFCGSIFLYCSGAMCGGFEAGRQAALKASGMSAAGAVDEALAARVRDEIFAPLGNEETLSYKELEEAARNVMNYYMGFRRSMTGMARALEKIRFLSDQASRLHADTLRDLMRCHEAKDVLTICELAIQATMERKESGRCVYRLTDYPEINPEMAKPLLLMRGENGPVYQWGKAPLL